MDCAWVDRPKLHPGLCQRVERNGQLLCGPTAPAAAPAAPFPTLVAAAAVCAATAATSAAAAALAAGDAAAALSTSVGACRAFRGQRDR